MFGYITPVVKNFLIVMGLGFLATLVLKKYQLPIEYLFLHYPDHPKFGIWQLITHIFMHGGFMHLLFNAIGLLTIGSAVESMVGSKKFILLFFISAIGSAFLQNVFYGYLFYTNFGHIFPFKYGYYYNIAMLGASGAIYGILTSFAYLAPNEKLVFMFIPYPIAAKYLVPILIFLDIFLGISNFEGDNIAHFAHVGGGLFGFLLCLLWVKSKKLRRF